MIQTNICTDNKNLFYSLTMKICIAHLVCDNLVYSILETRKMCGLENKLKLNFAYIKEKSEL